MDDMTVKKQNDATVPPENELEVDEPVRAQTLKQPFAEVQSDADQNSDTNLPSINKQIAAHQAKKTSSTAFTLVHEAPAAYEPSRTEQPEPKARIASSGYPSVPKVGTTVGQVDQGTDPVMATLEKQGFSAPGPFIVAPPDPEPSSSSDGPIRSAAQATPARAFANAFTAAQRKSDGRNTHRSWASASCNQAQSGPSYAGCTRNHYANKNASDVKNGAQRGSLWSTIFGGLRSPATSGRSQARTALKEEASRVWDALRSHASTDRVNQALWNAAHKEAERRAHAAYRVRSRGTTPATNDDIIMLGQSWTSFRNHVEPIKHPLKPLSHHGHLRTFPFLGSWGCGGLRPTPPKDPHCGTNIRTDKEDPKRSVRSAKGNNAPDAITFAARMERQDSLREQLMRKRAWLVRRYSDEWHDDVPHGSSKA